jgi:hypothetical protein
MKRAIRILAGTSFAGFMVFTIWRGIVQGVLEKPSFAVPHLDAGAGDWGLVLQLLATILVIGFGFVWLFTGSMKEKFIALAMVLVAPALFLYCARGLQNFAPQYSEAAFQQLIKSQWSTGPLKNTEVLAVLGEPLMRRPNATTGGETWLYSYMPSCGYGWDKKYVFLNRAGQVTDIYSFSEP